MRYPILAFAAAALLRAEVREVSLAQAVDLASKQNPDVLLSRLDEARAAQAARAAADPFRPKVYVGSGLAYSNGFPMSIEGAAPSVVQARGVASIYDKQKRLAAEQSKQDAKTAGIEGQERRDEAVYRAIELYLDAERKGRLSEMASRQVESARKVEQVVKVRVDEGRELPVEAKRASLETAKAEHRSLELRLDREQAEASLALILGMPAGDLARPRGEERQAPELPESAESAAEAAIRANRELSRLESALTAKGFEVRSARAAKLPKIDLVAQYGLFAKFNNYEDFFRRFQRHNGQIGMSVQVPVLAGPAVDAAASRAEAEAAKLRIELGHARNRIGVEARRRFLEVQRADSARKLARQALDVARADLDVQTARFDEGRATVKQVEEARLAENLRWMEYYDSQAALERARFALLEKTGGLLAAVR